MNRLFKERASVGAGRWSGRLFWEVLWPWLYYEMLLSLVYLLYGWILDDMVVMLVAMTAAIVLLLPVYLYRESCRDQGSCGNQGNRGNRTSCGNQGSRGNQAGCGSQKSCESRELRTEFRNWLSLTLTAVSASLFLNLFLIFSGAMGSSGGHEAVNEVLYSVPLWLQLLVVGLAAPLTEELIYRGFAYRRLRTVMGIVPAAAVTALFFALFHGNLLQGIYAGILGLFLALACEWGGLKAAVWFHVWANLTSIGMTFLTAACPELMSSQWLGMGLFFAGGAGTFYGGFCLVQVIRRSEEYNRK